jgi:galactokinase
VSTRAFRAPGRVNLIGEHTDYNDGFVMPAAIGFYTTVRVTPRTDRILTMTSRQFPDPLTWNLDHEAGPAQRWTDYVQGVAIMLERAGYPLLGADLQFDSTVPIGSGLSSSAALEVSAALGLSMVSGHAIETLELAQICRQAESEFVGLRCGIMDQFISLHGLADHAVLLDCRSLEFQPVPLPSNVRMVIANTMVKHELTGTAYNERRQDCESAAMQLGVPTLRAASNEMLDAVADEMPVRIRMRAQHVIQEIERTERAADALLAGDLPLFGQFMYESHQTLRDLYEVSCEELDYMVDIASSLPGVFGSRMTGGGFGGCTISLVEAEQAESFRNQLSDRYHDETGIQPDIYICRAVVGGCEVAP